MAATPEPASEAESFGPWLRRQREVRDIELRDIAQASKISLRYLDALENNRFEALPAEIFTKGFLRQYATFVGLDVEEVINYYLAAKAAADEQRADDVPDELRVERRRSRSLLPFVVLALLLLAVAAGAAWWLTVGRADADDEGPAPSAVERAGAVTAGGPADAPSPADAAGSPGDSSVGDASDGDASDGAPIDLVLDFSGDCWVEASIDGQTRIAEMHVQGESLRLTAEQQIELMVGNIETVSLELNGRPWRAPDGAGVVRRVTIDAAMAAGDGDPAASTVEQTGARRPDEVSSGASTSGASTSGASTSGATTPAGAAP